jgi:hypothetical protein
MINDELTGTLVLVHPELEYDPDGRQNEIGIIVNSDLANDTILVSFQDNEYDLFTSDALLLLLPDDDIRWNLINMRREAGSPDINSLAQVDHVLKNGIGDKRFMALEIARDNKGIQPLCLQTLEESLELNRGRGYE